MSSSLLFWLLLNFFSIVMLAFYSMVEMACVSFNKVRLQYYLSKGNKSAEWLHWLLQNPTRLFGTTLIGVNVATVFGSEFARESYLALGINPDFSPITQVILVVIFGELAPMFAARRYAEHVVMLGVPLVYASAKLMTPILWAFGGISKFYNWLKGVRETQSTFLPTQEELEKILEEQDEDRQDSEDFNAISANIFLLRYKNIAQVKESLESLPAAPSNATVRQVCELLRKAEPDYAVIFHPDPSHIVGIIHVRDLLRASPSRRARDYARPPWFVTQNNNAMQILNQFRANNQELAVILNPQGRAVGYIHMDDIIEEIFGSTNYAFDENRPLLVPKRIFIERTFPGNMTVGDFNRQFDVVLDKRQDLTLAELMIEMLGHAPEEGESVDLPPFELTAIETSLMEVKSIKVKG